MPSLTMLEALDYIHEHPETVLTPDTTTSKRPTGRHKGYVCPLCGSGTGSNGTGITSKDGIHFTCWSCHEIQHNDVVDIIAKINNLPLGSAEAFNKTYELYDIEISNNNEPIKNKPVKENLSSLKVKETIQQDNSEYKKLYESAQNAYVSDYLNKRGISTEIQEKYGVRYFSASHGRFKGVQSVVFMTDTGGLVERVASLEDKDRGFSNHGSPGLFNAQALTVETDKPLFIVESAIDALSILEVGGDAVATNSTSNANKLIEHLKSLDIKRPLVVAMDSDDSGIKAQKDLVKEINKLGIQVNTFSFIGAKDANELLQKDRKELEEWTNLDQIIDLERKVYELSNASNLTRYFLENAESLYKDPIPTGFKQLDEYLDGGLFEGLYVVGGVSSIGKTTYALQMATQVAATGQDVLIFSLEMSQYELIAKTVSRSSFKISKEQNGNIKNAINSRIIMHASKWKSLNEQENSCLIQAFKKTDEEGKSLYIIEGQGNISAQEVRERVEEHVRITGNAPVVLIDYLQIMKPVDDRADARQSVDTTVSILKTISRDFKTPVIVISSFNRDSYDNKIKMSAFKESGGIEYSSDVLLGIQFRAIVYREKDEKGKLIPVNLDAEKDKTPRELHITILKNRNGLTGKGINLNYYSAYNIMLEV